VKCPHCRTAFHERWSLTPVQRNRPEGDYVVASLICPECKDIVVLLRRMIQTNVAEQHLVWPKHFTRPVASEVDQRFADDYREAAATLPVSAKASAAVSRRCLQDVLREKAGVTKATLDAEIQEVIDSGTVPSWLSENLHAVRVVGNFAAHPIKSTNTGEVVDVEPGEAEFLLDVLDDLFDFYFVLPHRAEKQRAAISAKLQEAGKPPLER
jgi:hypothetical protein